MNVYIFNFPGGSSGKEPPCQCRRHKRWEFDPWIILCCMTEEMLSALGFWNTLYPREPAYLKDTINKLTVSSWSWVTSAGVGSPEGIRSKVQKDPR